MSNKTQEGTKDTFRITKDLIMSYHSKGYTVREIADEVSKLSGKPCSVGVINKASEVYGISMRSKPRKSGFVFDADIEAPVEVNEPQPTTNQN